MDEQDEAIPWDAPGLLWRVQEHRRMRIAKRTRRVPLRQRLRERGLRWSTEIVVGTFIAVSVATLVTVFALRAGLTSPTEVATHAGAAGPSRVVEATPSPGLCYIGAIARPCH